MCQQSNHPIDRRKQTIEVLVFMFLIVPSLALSFFVVKHGSVSFTLAAVATILRDLALVALVLYFIWDNREPLAVLGLRTRNAWREIAIGALLFVPFSWAASLFDQLLLKHGLHSPKMPPASLIHGKGAFSIILAGILVIVVAFSEETIFRGYLILRLRAVTASAVWAVLLSSVVFSLGHGYEGSSGLATVGAMGAVFAMVYLWRGNLLASMTMHFLQDFVAIVVGP
jgi:membrane protease YdiL (CAAX protease family)